MEATKKASKLKNFLWHAEYDGEMIMWRARTTRELWIVTCKSHKAYEPTSKTLEKEIENGII